MIAWLALPSQSGTLCISHFWKIASNIVRRGENDRMSDTQRIDAPVRLLEKLRPAQEQVQRLQAEIQAALYGASIALDVPEGWVWDGAGWVAPEQESPPVTTAG